MHIHLVLAATAMAVPAMVSPVHANDRMGNRAIVARDYAQAERLLVAERRRRPDMPELMLNLAAVYRLTDRPAEARALYARVLDKPPVAMDLASGKVASSHAIATAALASLPAANAIAAR